MSARKSRNIAASVRQRLLNRARTDQRPFSELLQYYAMERFLYRLSQSSYTNQFILKGALMLRVWHSPDIRPTMDIDMLGKTSNEEASIIAQIHEILSVEVDPDGLVFDPDSVRAQRITEDSDYEGTRVRFTGTLDNARVLCRLISILVILCTPNRRSLICLPCWIRQSPGYFATAVKVPLPKSSRAR